MTPIQRWRVIGTTEKAARAARRLACRCCRRDFNQAQEVGRTVRGTRRLGVQVRVPLEGMMLPSRVLPFVVARAPDDHLGCQIIGKSNEMAKLSFNIETLVLYRRSLRRILTTGDQPSQRVLK